MAFSKEKLGSILCMMTICLTACGDDLSTMSPVVDYREIAQPVEGQAVSALDGTGTGESSGEDGTGSGIEGTGAGGPGTGMEGLESIPVEPGPEEVTITITAAGDVTLGNYFEQEYSYSFCQTYAQVNDAGYFFENVYDIFADDDMTIVNLEGPLTNAEERREGQTYSIKGDPAFVELLKYGNIETVSFGNNHRLDYGEQGSKDTVEVLEEAGIIYAFDNNLGIYETKGIRIGIVSVNEFSNGAIVEKTLEEGIRKFQEEEVNLIFACCHWGVEGDNYPEDYQRILGKKCIDWGADLVIGHHPHVLQGIEEYQGKYIIYSLANFCFGANRNPADKDTMIYRQTFTFIDGVKQEDTDIQVIPCQVSSVTSRNDYKPTPAEGSEAIRILNRINEYSQDFGVQFDENGYLK